LIDFQEVWSTTWLNWKHPNYHYFQKIDEVLHVRNALIFFDEIAQPLDPRLWTKESSGVRAFFQLHGHRHNDIIGTTQDPSLVCKSALIIISKWFLCSDCSNFFSFDLIEVKRELLKRRDLLKPLDASDVESPDSIDETVLVDLLPSNEIKKYCFHPKKLYHYELNEHKSETHHYFAPNVILARILFPL